MLRMCSSLKMEAVYYSEIFQRTYLRLHSTISKNIVFFIFFCTLIFTVLDCRQENKRSWKKCKQTFLEFNNFNIFMRFFTTQVWFLHWIGEESLLCRRCSCINIKYWKPCEGSTRGFPQKRCVAQACISIRIINFPCYLPHSFPVPHVNERSVEADI